MACFVSSLPLSTTSSALGNATLSRFRPRRSALVAQPRRAAAHISSPRMSIDPMSLPVQLMLSDISDVNRGPLFATAFVFFLTFWGSISFVKGSTKDRITQASFDIMEPSADVAKKTARYLMERSFVADPTQDDRKGVMTFTGKVRASSSVASILVAVAASALWATTYILNFVLPPALQSDYWGLLTFASFLVVPWYWKKASRTETVKVMVEQETDVSTLYLKGHRDEIEQLEAHFKWKRNEPVYEGDHPAATPETATTN